MFGFLKLKAKVKRGVNLFRARLWAGLLSGLLVSAGLGVLVDAFLPWGFLPNLLRSLVAFVSGLFLFFGFYALGLVFGSRFAFGKGWFKSLGFLSYRQRVNFGVLVGLLSSVLFLLLVHPGVRGYTVCAGLLMCFWFWLVDFVKPSFEEVESYSLGLDDVRDLEFRQSRESSERVE